MSSVRRRAPICAVSSATTLATKIRILTMSQYRGEWPVNRMAQGDDVSPRTDLAGLYLVGDAVKPSGYLMVEGVAQSVNALLDTLDGWDRRDGARQTAGPASAGARQTRHACQTLQAARIPLASRAAAAAPRQPEARHERSDRAALAD